VNVQQSISINDAVNKIAFFLRNIFDKITNNILCIVNGSNCVLEPSPSPSPSPSPETPPSAGGGGAAVKKKSFHVSETEINLIVKSGETRKVYFTIINNGIEKLDFIIKTGLKDYITVIDKSFSIDSGKFVEIEVIITAPEEPRTYTTKLVIEADGISQEIPVIINVESLKELFDVKLNVPPRYKELRAGDNIRVEATIFNLKEIGTVDVTLSFIFKDLDDNIIFEDSEIVAVETSASFTKELHIPDYLKPDKYALVAQVKYKNSVSSSSSVITVVEETIYERFKMIAITLILIAFILLLIYVVLHIKKRHKKVFKERNLLLRRAYRSIKDYRKRRIIEEMVSRGVVEARRLQKELTQAEKRLRKKEKKIFKLREMQKKKAYLKKLSTKESEIGKEIRKLRGTGKASLGELQDRKSYVKRLVKELNDITSKQNAVKNEIKRLKSGIRS
ncbi:hypothetical protein HYV49_00660, partial [Candidatus Pacearchaeota archaeon]|nr:hypothetical protein [Candidatus Pacearchaeota archaeon]